MSLNNFDEVRFEDGIITRGTSGGPSFNTSVITTQSGKEYRVQNWRFSRGSWNLGNRTLLPNELKETQAFFQARAGKARGFRFKDWSDYKDDMNGILGNISSDGLVVNKFDGSSYFPLFKNYNSGGRLYNRRIAKPVNNTVKVFVNNEEVTQGNQAGSCSVDYVNGVVHFTPLATKDITSISKAANGVVKVVNHGLDSNDRISISIVSGMPEVDKRSFVITKIDNDNFYINENTSDYEDFSNGKIEIHTVDNSKTLTWTGEFDVPVRFDTDKLDIMFKERVKYSNELNERVYYDLNVLPIVELKVE